jgi:ABC-2 type transport system permease protein
MTTRIVEDNTQHAPAAALSASRRRKGSYQLYYVYCEVLKVLRDPAVIIFGLCFPSLFFLLFFNAFSAYKTSLVAQYAAYGTFGIAFQTLSIVIAAERSRGWNRLLRTTPISVPLNLGAKCIVIVLTGFLSLLLLGIVSTLIGGVRLDVAHWSLLLLFMVLGLIPFALAGMCLGYLGSYNQSSLISTVVTLFLSFTSGLFVPLQYMPGFIRACAPFLPTYHLGQLAWYAVGSPAVDQSPFWLHILVLAGFALVFAVLAGLAYRHDEQHNYI